MRDCQTYCVKSLPGSFPSEGLTAVAASGDIDPRDKFKEGRPEEYEGDYGKKLEEIYKRVAQLGCFADDEDVPLTPPKVEWIVPVPGFS